MALQCPNCIGLSAFWNEAPASFWVWGDSFPFFPEGATVAAAPHHRPPELLQYLPDDSVLRRRQRTNHELRRWDPIHRWRLSPSARRHRRSTRNRPPQQPQTVDELLRLDPKLLNSELRRGPHHQFVVLPHQAPSLTRQIWNPLWPHLNKRSTSFPSIEDRVKLTHTKHETGSL